MGTRVQLQNILEELLGTINVYFQPPETRKLKYPCIIYKRASIETMFANNLPYQHNVKYTVTVIDSDPDSEIPGKIAQLPMCTFDRHYTSSNLNHDVYSMYY